MIDQLRREVVQDVMGIASVSDNWPIWLPVIRKYINHLTPLEIINLGDHLSEIFLSTRGSGGRSQSSVSGGGAGWEGLVCWYLNLCLAGTSAIVFKKRSDVPKCVLEALKVTYSNISTNSESDLIAVTFPEDFDAQPLETLPRHNRGDPLSKYAKDHFEELSVSVVQCKTNWNDNAQIPMLWDIVYHAESFRRVQVMVGSTSYSVGGLKGFRYAFVTVPTTGRIAAGSQAVARVKHLSGGNYWGKPTENSVARSVKEIFAGAEIGAGQGRYLRRSLAAAVADFHKHYDYFGL